jgi:hypothetical protein
MSLTDTIDAIAMRAIVERWKHLHSLILIHEEGELPWTAELENAVVHLALQTQSLSTLVCTEWLTDEQTGVDAGIQGQVKRVPVDDAGCARHHAMPQLRRLWVKQLTAGHLRTIAAECPLLFEVVHKEVVSEGYIMALAGTAVRSVGFPGISAVGCELYDLSDLVGLRIWDIDQAQEEALEGLCARSPDMVSLDLHFDVRPRLSALPTILAAVPHLRKFSLHAVEPGEAWDSNVSSMVRAMAHTLCPQVEVDNVRV